MFLVLILSLSACLGLKVAGPYSFFNQNWYQHNGKVYNDGIEVEIRGTAWWGTETTDRAPGGLWTSHVNSAGQVVGHSISWFIQKMVDLGFNGLRIPISPMTLSNDPNVYPPAPWARTWDPSLTTGWKILNSMLANAQKFGMVVVVDFQTCNDTLIDINMPSRPDGCPGFTLSDWTDVLTSLALLARNYPNFMAVDLFNEPHYMPWSDWLPYANVGTKAVYKANPQILSLIEGNDGLIPGDPIPTNWGENLWYAGKNPPTPSGVPRERWTYSPHVYGKGNPNFQECFGYLADQGKTLIIGEFGYDSNSTIDTNDFAAPFIQYLVDKGISNWFYWAINGGVGQINIGFIESWDPTWCAVTLDKINRMKAIGLNTAAYITSTPIPSICN